MNRVYVVGIGPGAGKQMTEEAREVLNACDTIIGYTVYVDLVKEQFPEKEFLTTPMKQEVKLMFLLIQNCCNNQPCISKKHRTSCQKTE